MALKFNMIDTWANFPNFVSRYGLAVRKAIGNDCISADWRGIQLVSKPNGV